MADLSELRQLAEELLEQERRALSGVGPRFKPISAYYIEAVHPIRMLALLDVVEAAQRFMSEEGADDAGYPSAMDVNYLTLRAALFRLEEAP